MWAEDNRDLIAHNNKNVQPKNIAKDGEKMKVKDGILTISKQDLDKALLFLENDILNKEEYEAKTGIEVDDYSLSESLVNGIKIEMSLRDIWIEEFREIRIIV